ncbi:MAG: hypothetical protein IJT38_05725 [Clostridia bacterium]|nr:hypothetical protein [Clostridia bacterium]
MNEEQAKELMRKLIGQYENEIASLKAQQSAQEENDAEISEMKKNPYYSDIDSVRGEVAQYAGEHGLSMREAYGALYAEKKAGDAEREGKKIGALSQEGNAADDNFEEGALSHSEYWAAKRAGMSLADYLKYKNR